MEAPIQAFMRLGIPFRHVMSSDIDKHVKKVVTSIYKPETFYDDLTTRDNTSAPGSNLYVAGFPCQTFSIAGQRAGFDDVRGTVFFGCADYIRYHRPEAFILENVKGLLSHDGGRSFQTILDLLSNGGGTVNGQMSLSMFDDGLGYHVHYTVLNTREHGVPQNRERVFIVGLKEPRAFSFPVPEPLTTTFADLLEDSVDHKYHLSKQALDYMNRKVKGGRTHWDFDHHSDTRKRFSQAITVNHHKGVPYNVILFSDSGSGRTFEPRTIVPPLRANNDPGGGNVIMSEKYIRRFTPLECFRLQDFPDSFHDEVRGLGISDTQMYKMAGNSMTVRVIEKILRQIYNMC